MTYCLGIITREGLVLASDSRTNAGYDQVNVCRKMYTFLDPGKRALVILTSGSLSLTQSIHLDGAMIVTTPQEMAVGDSLRGAKMFERVGVRVVGVVENMSFYVCPHCGERSELFRAGGGERLAKELGVPLLGQVPLQAGVPDLADAGQPVVVAEPRSPAGDALAAVARRVVELVGAPAR